MLRGPKSHWSCHDTPAYDAPPRSPESGYALERSLRTYSVAKHPVCVHVVGQSDGGSEPRIQASLASTRVTKIGVCHCRSLVASHRARIPPVPLPRPVSPGADLQAPRLPHWSWARKSGFLRWPTLTILGNPRCPRCVPAHVERSISQSCAGNPDAVASRQPPSILTTGTG